MATSRETIGTRHYTRRGDEIVTTTERIEAVEALVIGLACADERNSTRPLTSEEADEILWVIASLCQRLAEEDAALARLEDEIAEAMKVLAPNMPESGLVDACKQVKQVALSEADNSAKLEAENKKLREENETLVMQLAGCSTAATQNTEASRTERIQPGHPYYSAAYSDICAAVDREMRLRADLAAKQQEVDQLTQGLADRTEDLRAGFDNADGLNALIQAERVERQQEVRQAFEAGMAARKPNWAVAWSFTPAEGMGPTYRRAFAAYQQQYHPTQEGS